MILLSVFWVQLKHFTLVSKLYLVGLLIKCQICWHAQKPILLWQLIFATIFYCDKSNFCCLWNSFTIFSVQYFLCENAYRWHLVFCYISQFLYVWLLALGWFFMCGVFIGLYLVYWAGRMLCLGRFVSAIGLWLAGKVTKETFADLVKIFSLTFISMGKWESDVFVWCYRIVC